MIALRQLWKHPAFSALAILVLALGIGANAAIFGFVDALMLKPLKVERPAELLGVFDQNKEKPTEYRGVSYPNFLDLRAGLKNGAALAAFNFSLLGVTERERTRQVFASTATSNFFSVMGAPLALGRGFRVEDDQPATAAASIVLSYAAWKKTGQGEAILGQSMTVNGQPFTVIGVAAPGFSGTSAVIGPEFWVPMGVSDRLADVMSDESGRKLLERSAHRLLLQYRLAPGQTIESFNAELSVLSAQLASAHPGENKDRRWVASPRSTLSVSTSPGTGEGLGMLATLLFCMSGAVLLIASLNLANMLLARTAGRRKEFAVRTALGAQRGMIVRQLLIECVVFALFGGVLAVFVALGANKLLLLELGRAVPFSIALEIAPNGSIFAATLGFCLLATLLAALGPALKASRSDVVSDLKDHAGDDRGSVFRGFRSIIQPRNALVIAQVALSLALLVVAGLFVRSAREAASADPGFQAGSGAIFEIDPGLMVQSQLEAGPAGQEEAKRREMFCRDLVSRLVTRLSTVPGVRSVSHASNVPFGMMRMDRGIRPVAADGQPAKEPVTAPYTIVGTDYFKTLGLPLLRGRAFSAGEMEPGDGANSVILDETLARRLFPKDEPLGQSVELIRGSGSRGEDGGIRAERQETGKATRRVYTVVGIVPALRYDILGSERGGALFVPAGADFQALTTLHLQLATEPGSPAETALMQKLQREIGAFEAKLPVLKAKTLRAHFSENVDLWLLRTGASVFAIFGLAALFLAVIGLYGVKSYVVARREREIGIRMALGADRAGVLRMILREGLILGGIGVALGLPLALGAGQLLSSALYRVSAFDPWVLGGVPLVLLAVAAFASYLPALRATRIQPARALRAD